MMEHQLNKILASKPGRFLDVFLPQEVGGLMSDMIQDRVRPELAAISVFEIDIVATNKCDALLILLDGETVDEGAPLN
jgi:hypothetical protein